MSLPPTNHQHRIGSTEYEANRSWKECNNFKMWLSLNQIEEEGVNGKMEPKKYVARGKLQHYWTSSRLRRILGADAPGINFNRVKESYLQTLSILAYISSETLSGVYWFKEFCSRAVDDHNLPFNKSSSTPFGDSPVGKSTWALFSESQWKFIPLRFRLANGTFIDRSYLPSTTDVNQILPITSEKVIHKSHREGTQVLKVVPHAASGLDPKKPIVMKLYPRKYHFPDFKRERDTYTWITNSIDEHGPRNYKKCFLEYHGCFIQGENCFILLEYADKGSLAHFFGANAHLPRSRQEAIDLWEDVSTLFIGLNYMHNCSRDEPRIHQDIRPENILVSEDSDRRGRFLFRFGDFGNTSVAKYYKNGNPTGPLNNGPPIYASPEVANIQENAPIYKEASLPSDIFSLGCVLYDCAVWMTLHDRGRLEFFKERVEATKALSHVQNAGYSGAFHDSFELLDIVRQERQKVKQLDSPVAHVCCIVMDFILSWMLSEERERYYAQQLLPHFKTYFSQRLANRRPSSPVRGPRSSVSSLRSPMVSPLLSTDQNHRESYSSNPRQDKEIPQVYSTDDRPPMEYKVSNQVDSQPSARPSTSPSPNDTLGPRQGTGLSKEVRENRSGDSRPRLEQPGTAIQLQVSPRPSAPLKTWTVATASESLRSYREKRAPLPPYIEQIQKRLEGRDMYIVVDNSASMIPHWQAAAQTAEAVFQIGLKADPDGVDICMTNGDTTSRKHKKSDDPFGRSQYFKNHRPTTESGRCDMQTVLNNILNFAVKKGLSKRHRIFRKIVGRKIEGISVFVLTNGVWLSPGDDEAGGVQYPIYNAISKLKSKYEDSRFLVIQFIGFGEDGTGIKRMEYLDNSLKLDKTDWDIVDFVHSKGSIEKIMIGALDAAVDKAADDSSQSHVEDGGSDGRRQSSSC
ncbi:kinase-like domain-containing protein [Nemania sp. NC0429]|nr:kinase-like domain-containing protein [Nemania sp. NC0429]